jgi:SAM-dependent methyltransferase
MIHLAFPFDSKPGIHHQQTVKKTAQSEAFYGSWEQTLKIFDSAEELVNNGSFPIVTSSIEQEIDAWMKSVRHSDIPNGKLVEVGCGGGRILSKLKHYGLDCYGLDNNPLMIQRCLDRDLSAEKSDVYHPISQSLKESFDFAGVSVNTIFNNRGEQRDTWIKFCKDLVKPGGLIMFSAYSYTKDSIKKHAERLAYYRACTEPFMNPGETLGFWEKEDGRLGVHTIDKNDHETWFTQWTPKKLILKQLREWEKKFDLEVIDMELLPCEIAYHVVLKKQALQKFG